MEEIIESTPRRTWADPSLSEGRTQQRCRRTARSHPALRQMTLMTNHAHEHVFLGAAHEENARRTLWVVMLTVVMMVAEIPAGYVTGSMALLADGFHMATHAGALGIAAAAYAYAKRHARSPRYSFGTGKVGDLGGFASALILALVALGIGVESVIRLLERTVVQFGTATLIAIVGLVVNIVSALLLGHGHSHGYDHNHEHDHEHHHQVQRQQPAIGLRACARRCADLGASPLRRYWPGATWAGCGWTR